MAKPNQHLWKYACKTPCGGLSGGDDVYVCHKCGKETLDWEDDSICLGKEPQTCKCGHPTHKAECKFACGCTIFTANGIS